MLVETVHEIEFDGAHSKTSKIKKNNYTNKGEKKPVSKSKIKIKNKPKNKNKIK